MMKFDVLSCVFALLASVNAFSAPVCGTIRECHELKSRVFLQVLDLLKLEEISWFGAEKQRATHAEAEAFCRGLGGRLPTIRELAYHGQLYGAQGVLETTLPGLDESSPEVQAEIARMKGSDFWPVTKTDARGSTVIDFYYCPRSYLGGGAPVAVLYSELWSSSVLPENPRLAYHFSALTGAIATSARDSFVSKTVRCVR